MLSKPPAQEPYVLITNSRLTLRAKKQPLLTRIPSSLKYSYVLTDMRAHITHATTDLQNPCLTIAPAGGIA